MYDIGDLLQSLVSPGSNWLECNGQAVSSTTYPQLYALMTTTPKITADYGKWWIKAK